MNLKKTIKDCLECEDAQRDNCPICLEKVFNQDKRIVTFVNCNFVPNKKGHVFHGECLVECLKRTEEGKPYKCPVCR